MSLKLKRTNFKKSAARIVIRLAVLIPICLIALNSTASAQNSQNLRPLTPKKFNPNDFQGSQLRAQPNTRSNTPVQNNQQQNSWQQNQTNPPVQLTSHVEPVESSNNSTAPAPQSEQSVKKQPIEESIELPYDIDQLNQKDGVRKKGQRLDLGQTIQKMAFSTFAVLVGCVVVLVAIKKFGLSKVVNQETESSGDMRVIDSVNIGPKCQLRVVQLNKHKIVVAVDPTGIKSVLHLSGAFTDELHETTN